MIDQSTIDRILDAAQIVDVVSEFVTLRKRGVNYIGLCPFHNEKTPSFSVSPSKGVCKCFSCGKGGNVVHFIMEHEQLSYYEALKWLAKKYNIELEVLSSLTRRKGTIVKEESNVEKMLISGVAKDDNIARISIIGVPDKPGLAFRIFSRLAAKGINVDIILQSIGRNGTKDISFTVDKNKMDDAIALLQAHAENWGASNIVSDDNVTKVSIVGAGMESHPGVAAEMFEALFSRSVNIQMISTSEIKISVLLNKADGDRAVEAIHEKFFENA